jgi:hypothetical protein
MYFIVNYVLRQVSVCQCCSSYVTVTATSNKTLVSPYNFLTVQLTHPTKFVVRDDNCDITGTTLLCAPLDARRDIPYHMLILRWLNVGSTILRIMSASLTVYRLRPLRTILAA